MNEQNNSIQNNAELEFAVFCIENLASKYNKDATYIYSLLKNNNILYDYIISCYDFLHTQDKLYILEDIESVIREKGLAI